jgi:Domain of unknown function (DUF5615)
MKLLFDENLSHKLVRLLADLFPNSVHVRDVGLKAADDLVVWEYAKNNDLMIVSKDSDMHQRSFMFGPRRSLFGFGWEIARPPTLKSYCERVLSPSKHSTNIITRPS